MSRPLMMSRIDRQKAKNMTRLARLDLEAGAVSQAADEQIFESNDVQKGKSDD